MQRIVRTDSENPDFVHLVSLLDAELAKRDGDEHAFYDQFNKITTIKHTVVIHEGDKPIACGAIKEFDRHHMEVKRMYTIPEYRGQGVASKILHELEQWTVELGYSSCVLETGKRQPEAIALYLKRGYGQTANYGQYVGIANSVCFRKQLIKKS